MDFLTITLGWFILILLVVWANGSFLEIPVNMVGVIFFFGKDLGGDEAVLDSGWHFVPFPCKVRLFPKKLIILKFRGGAEQRILSGDQQLLFPEGDLFLQLPYHHKNSLVDLLERGVPLNEEELTEWAKNVVLSGLRKVLGKRARVKAVSADEKDLICKEVNNVFKEKKGVFMTSGLFGPYPADQSEGEGYARLQLDQVLWSKPLMDKQEKMAEAEIDVRIAKLEAKAQKELMKALDSAMDEWVTKQAQLSGKTFAQTLTAAKKDGSWKQQYVAKKDQILAKSKTLTIHRVEASDAHGNALTGEGSLYGLLAMLLGKVGKKS